MPEHGMATIWDADVLIWAASQIVRAENLGLATSRFFRFTPYQLLRGVGRPTGNQQYLLLKAALARLQSTVIATTIRNGEHWRRRQSTLDLERQIEADGATWLDRRLVGRGSADLVAVGFGRDVQQAMDRRCEHLIEQGDAISHADGRIFYRRNLLTTLEQRDVVSTGTALAASRSVPFRATGDGETVQGVFKQTVQLSSGKFALVENAHEFTLVPWRPVIENRLGREVMGVVQGGSVSWQFGRKMDLGL